MKTRTATQRQRARDTLRTVRRRLLPVLIAGCFAQGAAQANPGGHQVVSGSATFSQQGNVLSITNSPGAIIHWQSFSIGADEITRFIQESAHSSVLNRVVGQDPSRILGSLQSNGRVFLVNPNGILFGQGARVDVNGLVASTLDIANEDFLAGRLTFAGSDAGDLKNAGTITTPAGGQVYLVAPNVENTGLINAPNGDVLLAAGHSVHLVDSTNPALQVVLSAPENEAVNVGEIVAQGGTASIYGALIRQRGRVSADSAVVGEDGKIVFKASRDTMLEAGSVTSATGAGRGGEILVLGDCVGLVGDAKIDASGRAGGGKVLVGGDYQGRNADVPNASFTYMDQGVQVTADALESGDGGTIVVWADNTTRAFGRLQARGGAQAGDGGFVEVSGKRKLEYAATTDVSATRGQTGTLLLDPESIVIYGGSCAQQCAPYGEGSPGSIFYEDEGPSILYESQIEAQSATADIILEATRSIRVDGMFDDNDVRLAPGSNLVLRTRNGVDDYGYGGDLAGIDLTSSSSGTTLEFRTQGSGTITLEAGTADEGNVEDWVALYTGNLASESNISLRARNALHAGGNVQSTGGKVSMLAREFLVIEQDAQIQGEAIEVASVFTYVGGNLRAGSSIDVSAGSLSIEEMGSITGENVSLRMDDLMIHGFVEGGSDVHLAPVSDGREIHIGEPGGGQGGQQGEDDHDVLTLASDYLNRITTTDLRIGSMSSGDLTLAVELGGGEDGALAGVSRSVSFYSGGAITQSDEAAIAAGYAIQASGASVDLVANNGASVIAGRALSGDFRFRSSNTVTVGEVDGVQGIALEGNGAERAIALDAGIWMGPEPVSSEAAIHIARDIDAGAGRVELFSLGAIEGEANVRGDSLIAVGMGRIDLNTRVGSIVATNSNEASTEDIRIVNNSAGASAPLHVTLLHNAGSGGISLDNYGALYVDANEEDYPSVFTTSGSIALAAHSPLIVNGLIESESGGIHLVAHPSAAGNDDVSINGGIQTTGTVALSAGGKVHITGSVSGTPIIQENLGEATDPNPAPEPAPSPVSPPAGTNQVLADVENTINTATSQIASAASEQVEQALPEQNEAGADEDAETPTDSESAAESNTGASNEKPATKLYCN